MTSIEECRKGLSSGEIKELVDYIEENHSWKNIYDISNKNANQKIIKYYSMTVDSRDNTVWAVKFYSLINCGEIEEITFRTEQGYNLKDKIYEWLKNTKK